MPQANTLPAGFSAFFAWEVVSSAVSWIHLVLVFGLVGLRQRLIYHKSYPPETVYPIPSKLVQLFSSNMTFCNEQY